MAFEIEHATYQAHLDELRPRTGAWVLIHKTEITGIYTTLDEVVEADYTRFSPGTFYITQIETPVYMNFDLSPEDVEIHHKAA